MPHWLSRLVTMCCLASTLNFCLAVNVPITLFPLNHYDQNIDHWIKPSSKNYRQPLLSPANQQARTQNFYQHVYGDQSPWSANFINQILKQKNYLLHTELSVLNDFNNTQLPQKDLSYNFNFHKHRTTWFHKLYQRMQLAQLQQTIYYHPENRAILINNASIRALPTQSPSFHRFTEAGEGYPFDMLQVSSIWAGTPIYILGETDNHMWALITSASTLGWVPTHSFAKAEPGFINAWHLYAKHGMAAITQTQTPIIDTHAIPQFQAYVGAVFPLFSQHRNQLNILIPVRNSLGNATIHHAIITNQQATKMPLRATPKNFSLLMHTLIGRPYGWGGLYFDNDCSQELKSLFVPFGIWLPRHSSDQIKEGRIKDLSRLTAAARIDYLKQYGHPFLTLIHIKNHIMLYIGTRKNPYHPKQLLVMTYQNLWGLAPKDRSRRVVIGQSVVFPLLKHYPEEVDLDSLASSSKFTLSDLRVITKSD